MTLLHCILYMYILSPHPQESVALLSLCPLPPLPPFTRRPPRRSRIVSSQVNLVIMALQWVMAVHPEHSYDFEGLGAPHLAAARSAVSGLLSAHWIANAGWVAASVASLLPLAYRHQGSAGASASAASASLVVDRVRAQLICMNLGHVAVSLLALRHFPRLFGCLLFFTVTQTLQNGLRGLSFPAHALQSAASLLVYFAAPAVTGMQMGPAAAEKAIMINVGGLFHSRILNWSDRVDWRARQLLAAELRLVRSRLYDLLPRAVAEWQLDLTAPRLHLRCEAVVLQLDICGFTSMSQNIPPIEVSACQRKMTT
jgi:hypothetical protein